MCATKASRTRARGASLQRLRRFVASATVLRARAPRLAPDWRQNPQQTAADPSHTSSTTVVPRPEKPSGASATVTYEYISSCETERAREGGGWRRSAWLPRRRARARLRKRQSASFMPLLLFEAVAQMGLPRDATPKRVRCDAASRARDRKERWGAGGVPRRPRRRCACGRSARGCGGEPVVWTGPATSGAAPMVGENPRSFARRRGYRKRAGRGEDARCGCP